jgi:signal transduction histidine kinase
MLIGQPVLAIFHPEDRAAVLQRMDDANRTTGRVESWELRKLHRDGRIVWVRENVRRLAGSGHLLVLCEDVTEQRALEERILGICERERESMAGDLHDDLGQRLAGLTYLVRALHLRLQDAGHAEADSALQIAAHADDALARLRALSHVMSAQGVPERGLVPSLRMLAEVFAAIHGIQCSVLADPRVALDERTDAADLYRIVQEALTNALRHGRARRVEIALALRDGRVVLHVHDDGCGITAAGRDPEGMGLRTMRYRANRLGASFTAQPAAAGGFEVLVMLPAPG